LLLLDILPVRTAIRSVTASAAILTLAPAPTHACSCIGPIVTCNYFWTVEYVFEGTVRTIDRVALREDVGGRQIESEEYLVSLEVHRAWKGVDGAHVEVLTHTQETACGFSFQQGGRYLVFASRRPTDGKIGVNKCGPTKEISDAADDVAWLESLSQPSTGGRVYGEMVLIEQNLSGNGESQRKPLEDIRITLDGTDRRRETRTGPDGRYELLGVPAGKYQIAAHLSPDLMQSYTSREIEIPDPRGCAQEDFWTSINGSIEGRVLQADGSPAQRVLVQLTAAGTDLDGGWFATAAAPIDVEGFYKFEGLPPGRYVIGVNLRNARRLAYPRTLHMTNGQPTIIDLQRAEGEVLLPIRLPPPRP
jgi:Carboxypeptidase regulatory-like domain